MQIIRKSEQTENLSLALGFFDGVHIAHQKVISSAVDFAQKNGLKSGVVTFKEHPVCILKNVQPSYISPREYSYELIEKLGIDYLIELDFNKISDLSADEYLHNILMKYFSPKAIFTGFNHTFGVNRTGNARFLKDNSEKYNYKYFEIPPQTVNSEIVSSSKIREYIKNGEILQANSMLGRNFCVDGTVTTGNKIGRTIGFPTANLIYPPNIIEIPNGVYAVKVTVKGKEYKGIANFGNKPTVCDNCTKILEVNIFDFDENIYFQNIGVKFLKFIRPEKKFSGLEELREQIKADITDFCN